MGSRRAIFLYTPELEQYSYPDHSPFVSQRAGQLRRLLLSMGLLHGTGVREVAPRPAARADLERFHRPEYLDALEAAQSGVLDAEGFLMGIGTPDCPVFPGLYAYATLASGASVQAARMLLSGEAEIAFNPSGGYHHAGPALAAGFCYLNDVVLAAMILAGKRKRVLFLDLDVHHGDGVQNAFFARRDVMTISLHESGKTLFPGTGFTDEIGLGEGRGYCVNCPLPPGTYDQAYLRAFTAIALPLITVYDPAILVVELGMDTLAGDPLAHLTLTNNVYADILGLLLQLDKPILATGGGGYHIANTVRGWALCWSLLSGQNSEDDFSASMGGVMLASTEWQGGLRDRALHPGPDQRARVDAEVDQVIQALQRTVFPLHGLA